jgi:hypothetical protein
MKMIHRKSNIERKELAKVKPEFHPILFSQNNEDSLVMDVDKFRT